MPRVEATRVVPVDTDTAFAVWQRHGATRLLWDPFVHHQRLIDADWIGVWLLGGDIEQRIEASAAAYTNPEVLAAVDAF